jgi:penicillin G amidase
MSPTLKKFLVVFLSVLLVIVLVVGAFGYVNVTKSFPQTDGQITISSINGLSALSVKGVNNPVDIYRDQMGIPHIYASTLHDLFFAQGYVHAQDRFWQMDFWRHIGSARLSEMFGKSQVDTDAFLRTLGWEQIAEQEWENLTPESKDILNAYTEGVNAYLSDHTGTSLSLEYGVLKLINPGYVVEPWTPVNSLTWSKAMAWDLRGNLDEEIQRSILLKTLSQAQVDELFPPYPSDHPLVVPIIGDFTNASASKPESSQSNQPASLVPMSALLTIQSNFNSLAAVLGPSGSEIGSNNWAVSGSKTSTGKPLLANDPHLAIQMPSIWYQIDMHCKPKSDACPFEVGGFSFAGVPGVIIGHNDKIAWAFTNVGPDVMDLYVEKVNPENPDQYEVNGKWEDMTLHQETIKVAGGDPVNITVRATRHGPVVSDTYEPLLQTVRTPEGNATPAKPYTEQAGIPLPNPYVVSLRWTALEPGSVFEAIWGFDKAKDWQEFRDAARNFQVPAQNLLYADTEGNIAYQMPGKVPIRKNGDGRLPVPGWTDDYEWAGYIPFKELPYAVNPPSGYIVSANNQVPPANYPYLVTTDWDYGFRAQRIVDMITHASGSIDIAYFQKMQGDDKSLNAELLVPILMKLNLSDPKLVEARNVLANWDYQETMDSKAASVFEWFWWDLLMDTFKDDLPQDYWPKGGNRWYEVMRALIQKPDSPWWDDQTTTDKVETRDDIIARAFSEAVSQLEKKYSNDPDKWPAWGELHTATFKNATLGKSGIPPIEALFNRGPFQTAGGESIVNATGWDVGDSFEVNWLPSMRMIVDLSNLNNSVTVHTTGESGHAYNPHYVDMADLWRNIEYYPMLWDEQSIIQGAEAHMQLRP